MMDPYYDSVLSQLKPPELYIFSWGSASVFSADENVGLLGLYPILNDTYYK